MRLIRKIFVNGITAGAVFVLACVFATEQSKKEARVTRIIREVKLLPSEASPRPAVIDDQVREGTAVRTGDNSRSELTFLDLTISRLGANTIFSFNKAGRDVDLTSGSILLRVPKDSGGAVIKTSAVTAGITGTTVILEAPRSGRSKLIVLEGGARLSLRKYAGQSAYVRAGQMLDVPAGATKLPAPVNIDLNQVMRTHPLITDFPPLPSRPLIAAAIQDQQNPPSGPGPVYPGRPVAGQPSGPWVFPPSLPPGRPVVGGKPGSGTGTQGPGQPAPPTPRPVPGGGKTPAPVSTSQPTAAPSTGTIGRGGQSGSPAQTSGGGLQPVGRNALGPPAGTAQAQSTPTPRPIFRPRGLVPKRRPTPSPIR
jgi:hypothetical protein